LSSSSQTQRSQNTQKNKTKNQKKGRSLRSSSRSTFSFLAPTSTLFFQTLSLSIFFFLSKRGKKQRKKNHKEEKKCKEGKEVTFKLSLCPLTSSFCFWPHISCLSSFFSLASSSSQV
jgi:hypothetical protein